MEIYGRNMIDIHEEYNDEARYYLKLLPDPLATRLFATLRKLRPGVLSHAYIAAASLLFSLSKSHVLSWSKKVLEPVVLSKRP